MMPFCLELMRWVEGNHGKHYVTVKQRTPFPAHSPKLRPWHACMFKMGRISCVDLGVGSSAAEQRAQERQILRSILADHFPPSPSIGFIKKISDFLFLAATPRFGLGLQACMGCGGIALPVHSYPVAAGSPTEHIFPTPFPKSKLAASNRHASAA